MKKIVLLVTTLILSCFNLTAQDEKTTDLVGYGGGQYEVFKTGGQESIELWFKWMELHVSEDLDGILELAHDEIYIEAPEATLNGKSALKEWLTAAFSNGDITVEHRWAVPLRFVNEDGSVNPGDWIVNDYVVNYKTDDNVTIDDSEANVYIVNDKVRYIKIFTFKKETLQTKRVTFSRVESCRNNASKWSTFGANYTKRRSNFWNFICCTIGCLELGRCCCKS